MFIKKEFYLLLGGFPDKNCDVNFDYHDFNLKIFRSYRMKIAYLITAYNNYNHLKRLIGALNDENVVFFIHIDKKSTMADNLHEFENIIFIEQGKVWWAGWSHVEAILRLIKSAISYRFDYYILLSGTDYPIRPNSFLYKKLSAGGEFISMNTGFGIPHAEDRIKYYYFDGFDRRNLRSIKTVFFFLVERTIKLFLQKKSYPFHQIYYGPTWWALSHNCIKYVLAEIDNNKNYIQFFKTSWASDESFFHTIIGSSQFSRKCTTNLTYNDWSSEPKPAWINQNHVKLFKKQFEFDSNYGIFTPFFARKFDDSRADIVELIEKELRN
jgi:hypothetical protein